MDSDQTQHRLEKLKALQDLGIEPYGRRFEVRDKARDLQDRHAQSTRDSLEEQPVPCTVAGRLMSLRRFGKTCFSHLQDDTGKIQLYFKNDRLTVEGVQVLPLLDLGDWIGVQGKLFFTKTGELTIFVEQFTLLSKSLRPMPEKWHGLSDVEIRYRQRYLDLIANPAIREIFRTRSRIIECLRIFLNQRGFMEVETPMMQSTAGGAAARPFVTHHQALDLDLYLRIAPELYLKRLVVGGFERVYEINRNFRNEGISTIHNPEFTMLEFYQAYADYRDLMPLTEELITFIARETIGTLKVPYRNQVIDLTPPWERLDYLDAIAKQTKVEARSLLDLQQVRKIAQKLGLTVEDAQTPGKILDQIFTATVEPHLDGPVFIMDYPTDASPLARRHPDRPELTERFELYIAGREIANAFSELNDPMDQRKRFQEQADQRQAGDPEAHPMDEDFLRALEYGMPPAAGEGIGVDRLTMILTNQASIREVILFPQLRPERP